MDAKVKKCCPNCSQHFSLKSSHQPKCRLPLLLKCGHTVCQLCIENMMKFSEPIDCKVCQNSMEIDNASKLLLSTGLYSVFPVNVHLVGELTLLQMEAPSTQSNMDDCYIDTKAIINSIDGQKGKCVECQNMTTKMCKQCETVLCSTCFSKSHKFHIFKSHILKEIDLNLEVSNCNLHPEKPLDYYCKDCDKLICMDCMIVGGEKSCKNHNIASPQDMNNGLIDELNDMSPKIDEIFKRLTNTAVEIGHMLKNIESDIGKTELDKVSLEVQNYFSKVYAMIQNHEQAIFNNLAMQKNHQKSKLIEAKSKVAEGIKQSKLVLKKIEAVMTSEAHKKVNLAGLMLDAKSVLAFPWYLDKQEKSDDIRAVLAEDLTSCNLSQLVVIQGGSSTGYVLRDSEHLPPGVDVPPPPAQPVFPPELLKDIREQSQFKSKNENKPVVNNTKNYNSNEPYLASMPRYKSKSGSISSLNSVESESSYKRKANNSGDAFQGPIVQPVSPFVESNHPKQLQAGSQEIIYISHIISPHELYVQRACHQPQVKAMLREFRHAGSLPTPTLSHVTEGKIYLGYNKVDKEWQRCRIVSIDRRDQKKPLFTIFCIDFGSTEIVPLDKLRLIPAARVQSPAALALSCSLHNIGPVAARWTAEDSVLIHEIIDNKQAVLHVRGVVAAGGAGAGGATLLADITSLQDGVSLSRALVFHERARFIDHTLPPPRSIGLFERPKLFFSNSDFKPKMVEEVTITHIISPDKFYVRETCLQDTFEKLLGELEENYTLSVPSGSIYCPEVGMVCAMNIEKYPELGDYGWRRGLITDLPGRGRVHVLLPDTGHTAVPRANLLRHLKPEHAKTKPLATECHLSGVTPLNKKWNLNSVTLLQSFIKKPLELHVEEVGRGRNSVGVTLYDKTDPDNPVCINTLMIKYKFAVSIGLFAFNKEMPTDDLVYTTKSPKLDKPKPKSPPKKGKKITILKRNETPPQPATDTDLEAKDKGPIKLEVKVLSCQSPSLIYVTLIDQQKAFKEVYDELQEYYTFQSPPAKQQDWKVGDKCCTLCKDTKTWRRSVVMELKDDTAKVFYSDFATVDSVKTDELLELKQEFSKIGDAAIKCHLCGVMPAVGTEWPSLTKEYLRELVEAYPRVFITKNGAIKDKSLPVEMWVYHVTQGGALDPDQAEWRCLNKKIIEQGLGVPDKSKEKEEGTDADDIMSLLGMTGTLDEWLRLDPEPAPVDPDAEPEKSSPTPIQSEHASSPEPEDVNDSRVYITDWLPSEPLPSQEFTGYPTYVDNDGIIYLHDVTQKDTLDLIRNALDVRFKYKDPRGVSSRWAPGQPCIARFYLDNKFYRGRVLEVNPDTRRCIVHYVDYGNDECCAFKDLRKTIVLHEIPIQAHRCVLGGIRPAAGHWDKTALDYIHKSVVEKRCLVQVTGKNISDVTPIRLKFDKLWLNAHLVDFEMAAYTDGHKRVVTEYISAPTKRAEVDSHPDYIVEDSNASEVDVKDFVGKSWSEMIEEEERDQTKEDSVTYPEVNWGESFSCNVSFIHDDDVFELTAVQDEETARAYEEMNARLQAVGEAGERVESMGELAAVAARYGEDGRWYRAAVLGHNRDSQLIKVRYVDFGNVEVVRAGHVRALPAAAAALPPAAAAARLPARRDPALDRALVQQQFEHTFLAAGPFRATVLARDDSPLLVQLTHDDGSIVYEKLIADGILLAV